ncbi:hypothetical protein [Nocardia transvalensis]|uniref:hypothetical protein n=1 Tax=Nocardia transvalensis TaxID=37333 RepID=UPI001895010C|nr:hypothetical protein [Nocardia transvalensis]MBF6333226.1 hypothetical protein [Nocardia transvalensis]
MTRNNSAATRAARSTARSTGMSYTAALYAQRAAVPVTPESLVIAGWGPDVEIFAPVTDVRADTNYRLVWVHHSYPSISCLGTATGRHLLAQPRVTHHRYGDQPLVDIRPLVDFDTQRNEYGSITISLGVASFDMSVGVLNVYCDGCPFHQMELGLERALDTARDHNDQHREFPGDWGYQRTPDGRWRRIRS